MDTKFKKEEFVILPDGEVGQVLETNYKNKKDFYLYYKRKPLPLGSG